MRCDGSISRTRRHLANASSSEPCFTDSGNNLPQAGWHAAHYRERPIRACNSLLQFTMTL